MSGTLIDACASSVQKLSVYGHILISRAGRYISCDMHAHLVSKAGSLISGYIYIYAFSRRFYPKRLTLHSSYSFTFYQLLLSLGIELMILALLAPCSTIWATGKLINTGIRYEPVYRPALIPTLNDYMIIWFVIRAARLIKCDCHAHLVSKAGSVINSKSPSPAFRWSSIYNTEL